MNDYFAPPRARKAQANAAMRGSLWQPLVDLIFPQDGDPRLIVRHAANNRHGQTRATATALLALGMRWDGNPSARYFHIDRTAQNYRAIVAALTEVNITPCRSFTVSSWLRETALLVQHTNGRSKLFKV